MKGKITISSIGPIKNLEKVEQIQSRKLENHLYLKKL